MKTLFLTGLLAISSFGQFLPKCDVPIDKLPALQGIRLRMPVSELVKLPVVEKPSRPPVGARDFESVERVQVGGKDRAAFYLRTYDEKVFSLGVYDEDISTNIDDFVRGLSNKLNLPLDPWFKHSDARIILCIEFEITVNPTPNLLTLLDLPAFKKIGRTSETQEQKRSKP